MKVQNQDVAGLSLVMPNGHEVTFDANGHAEVPDDCGIHMVPGYTVVEGRPKAVATPKGEIKQEDGPTVFAHNPALANQEVVCPDGHTVAKFDHNGVAAVPDTCGLDHVPGHAYYNSEGEVVQGNYKPPTVSPAERRRAQERALPGAAPSQRSPIYDAIQQARGGMVAPRPQGGAASSSNPQGGGLYGGEGADDDDLIGDEETGETGEVEGGTELDPETVARQEAAKTPAEGQATAPPKTTTETKTTPKADTSPKGEKSPNGGKTATQGRRKTEGATDDDDALKAARTASGGK